MGWIGAEQARLVWFPQSFVRGPVITREYGFSEVVSVDEATRRLKTGQRVQVDGSASGLWCRMGKM
jgi:hypothetical protein